MNKKHYNYIDLFAGAGGLSEGFLRAGYEPIAHVEMNKEACDTLRTRNCYYYLLSQGEESLYYAYLKGEITRKELYSYVPSEVVDSIINVEISDATINSTFDKIDKLANGRKVDFIIGGPPCQAYSLLGRHNKGMEDDPRTLLYLQYGKFLKRFNPLGFVFENVPGLLSAKKGEHFKNLQIYFDEIGYKVHYRMLDASNYGVLQGRKRLIIIGWRKNEDFGYPEIPIHRVSATVNDILEDLPTLYAGDSISVACYANDGSAYLKESGIRQDGVDFVTQNFARKVNATDAAIYAYAIQNWNDKHVRIKYTDLPKQLQTQRNNRSFLDRFKVVDGNGYAHTIVAHLSKDGHYYIHPDIRYKRSLSVREAARIQSFPDNFYFEGSRSAIFKQIGNAVPPLMAEAIASALQNMLNEKR